MKATKEQIIAEANRRRAEHGEGAPPVEHYIVDVVCENWTPPDPVVDPDILAWREWVVEQWPDLQEEAISGETDSIMPAQAYLAGARMAREQERERANMPIGMAGALVDRCQRLLHSLPAGVHDQLDVKWGLDALCRAIEAEIAKYRGEA